jgi:hypothetical protein
VSGISVSKALDTDRDATGGQPVAVPKVTGFTAKRWKKTQPNPRPAAATSQECVRLVAEQDLPDSLEMARA